MGTDWLGFDDNCIAIFSAIVAISKFDPWLQMLACIAIQLISQHQNPQYQIPYFVGVKLLPSCHHPVAQLDGNVFLAHKQVPEKNY